MHAWRWLAVVTLLCLPSFYAAWISPEYMALDLVTVFLLGMAPILVLPALYIAVRITMKNAVDSLTAMIWVVVVGGAAAWLWFYTHLRMVH